VTLDTQGFLHARAPHTHTDPVLFRATDLMAERCVVFLGEPSSGKSRTVGEDGTDAQAIRDEVTKGGGQCLWVDLAQIFTASDFDDTFEKHPVFQGWAKGAGKLFLFLDSLDECRISIPTIAHLLLNLLKRQPRDNVFLRIVCRNGEWPTFLEAHLRQLYAQELRILHLAPLTVSDVIIAAEAEGVNVEQFLNRVHELNAAPFARKPSTLMFLLAMFAERGDIPESQFELYEVGCRIRCDEYNKSRIAANKIPDFTPDQLLAVAGRIALLSLLSARSDIAIESTIQLNFKKVLSNSECVGGSERATPGGDFEVTRNAVRQTLSTALFQASGLGTVTWETRNIAEFLAARQLLIYGLTRRRILSLIVHPSDDQGRIVPQLHNIAAWLAERSDDIFQYVLSKEAHLLLTIDQAALDDQKRQAIVTELIRQAQKSNQYMQYNRRFWYSRLGYPNIDRVLRLALKGRNVPVESQIVACEICVACNVSLLADISCRLALTAKINSQVRILLVLIVGKFGSQAQRRRIKRLLRQAGTDKIEDLELVGALLSALWPQQVRFSEVRTIMASAAKPDITGLYTLFVRNDLAERMPTAELTDALKWIASEPANRFSWAAEREVQLKLIWRALEQYKNPALIKFASRLLYQSLRLYDDVLGADSLLSRNLSANTEIRRSLIEALLERPSDPARDWVFLLPLRTLLAEGQDLSWLLELGSSTTSSKVRQAAAKLVPFLVDSSPKTLSALWRAAERWPELRATVAGFLEPISLDSQLARELREEAFAREQRDQLKETAPHRRLETVMSDIGAILAGGELDAWPQIAMLLETTGSGSKRPEMYPLALTDTNGWKRLDAQEREACLARARHYVTNGDPKNDTWLETNSWPGEAVAGFHALVLLARVEETFVEHMPQEIWTRWTPVLMTFFRQNAPETTNHLLDLAYRAIPDEFLGLLSRRIIAELKHSGHAFVLSQIDHLWDDKLADLVLRILRSRADDKGITALLVPLLVHKKSEALSFSLSILDRFLIDRTSPALTLAIAEVLLQQNPRESWDRIWQAIQSDEEFGKKLVGRATHQKLGSLPLTQVLGEEELGQLLKWLFQRYPVQEETKDSGPVTDLFSTHRFRDALLVRLVSYGTPKAITILGELEKLVPEVRWKYYLLAANDKILETSWVPTRTGIVLEVLRDSNRRYVRNAAQLLEVVDEALDRISVQLRAEAPMVDELWNYTTGRQRRFWPKDEAFLSKWLKNRLQAEIIKSNVIIAREVEIRPHVEARGERTDLYIASRVAGAASNPEAVVILEVKGCWNKDVKTAMRTQLAERYLRNNFYTHGVYLVGWYATNLWEPKDKRRHTIPFATVSALSNYCKRQAAGLSKMQVTVWPRVLNLSLIDEAATPSKAPITQVSLRGRKLKNASKTPRMRRKTPR
jgi:hypothetical protein